MSVFRVNKTTTLETSEITGINRLIVVLMVCFVLSSSFSKIGIFDVINKGIIGMLCLVILGLFFRKRQPRFALLLLSLTALIHVVALAFPVSSKEGIATYFTFAFWVLFWLYVVNNGDEFLAAARSLISGLRGALIVWTIVTLISFFTPVCYKIGWGGGRYFTSFTTDSFEIAPVAMFILALNILLYQFTKDKRFALLFSLVPLACVFAAGTRTYLIVVLVEFVLLLRLLIEKEGQFYFAFAACLIIFIFLASVTNIGLKFASTTLNSNDMNAVLTVFTNGRNRFWAVDFEAYLQGNVFEKLFGHGFSYVYELNQSAIGMRLYAHNDFINILLNFGLSGLILYLAVFLPVIVVARRDNGMIVALLLLVIWLFNAFFNMIYVYIAAVMALGVLSLAISTQRLAAGVGAGNLGQGRVTT
ncbi:O-antigen ligase family protein [Enorma phocaeensis]|uniref:O-antigen ligase family protein n=1 Tax=Enorma phocaeensis TaxID=1871019 RepID=A0ABT7V6Q9_9ACTN|nr:O-antigen ligase family protein [Enorma phocaeensis]MDM8274173.1 O-antigen ligase family protein [Enorma phocaeensis]